MLSGYLEARIALTHSQPFSLSIRGEWSLPRLAHNVERRKEVEASRNFGGGVWDKDRMKY